MASVDELAAKIGEMEEDMFSLKWLSTKEKPLVTWFTYIVGIYTKKLVEL